MKNKICLLLLILILPGCISLLPESGNPSEYIHLNPQLIAAGQKCNKQVVVDEPTADLLHNSTKIIIIPQDQQQYKFAMGKEWHERMPTFVQRDIIKAISAKGLLGVGTPSMGIKPDYILVSTINKFLVSTHNPNQPQVMIEADFSIVNMPGRQVIAHKTFTRSQATAKGFNNIIKGFECAYSDMLNDVSDWVIKI